MTDVFLRILNMSISAGWLVMAVLGARLLLKRAPKWVNVLLWAIVALRLVCPFSLESALSLIPSAETVSPDIMLDPSPSVHTGIASLNSAVNPVIYGSFAPSPSDSMNPLQLWVPIASAVWIAGVAGMAVWAAVNYIRLRHSVSTAVRLENNVFQSENGTSPFVLGLFRPRIYVPFGLTEQELSNIVAHEQTHIRRKDHIWKPLGYLILAVHWFNPLVWVGYALLCRDIELACDEKVIKTMDAASRADYSQVLLSFSSNRRRIAACPLAFGEVSVKSRVKSVLSYKKPALWVMIGAVTVCGVIAVCFLTDPPDKDPALRMPLERVLAGYAMEDAAGDGCVVIDGGVLIAGQEQWINFVNAAERGEVCSVRIYQAYSHEDGVYFVKDLSYDGQKYAVRFYDSYADTGALFLSEETYGFLLRQVYSPYIGASAECWFLADSEAFSAEEYFKGLVSSTAVGNGAGRCLLLWQRLTDEEEYVESYYDTIYFDADGDGSYDRCCIGMGRTSGVFSFTVSIYNEKGKKTAEGFFVDDWSTDLAWEPREDGLFIRAERETGTGFYSVDIKKKKVILEINGEPIENWVRDDRDVFQNAPEDFGFTLSWNTCDISSYDSRTGKLVRTGGAEEYLFLDDADMNRIYAAVQGLELRPLPEESDGFISYSAYHAAVLTVYSGENATGYEACVRETAESAGFIALCRDISEIILERSMTN